MKQLELTSFVLFLFFLTESLPLPTKPQDADDFSVIQKFIEENVEYITTIMFSQYIQEVAFEELQVMINNMVEYRDKCVADRTLPECSKSANEIFQEKTCSMEGLPQKYNFSHCCSKVDFERRLCFFYNKKGDGEFQSPFPTLEPEEKCQAYQNVRKPYLHRNVAVFSQKFPRVEFKELLSLIEEISSMYDGCCEGDAVQCIRDSAKVMNHICSKQDSISTKIKDCCGKKMLERAECIFRLNRDDKPKDLSAREPKFTDSKNACQERDINPDNFFAEFTYEYSRRHQDLSIPEILRISQVYEDLLGNCCNTENPQDCYSHAEEKFNETTEKSLKIVKQECDSFQNLGKEDLKYHLLIRMTKKVPQLSTEELIFLGKEMVTVLTTCCTQSEEFACVDNLADLVLGEFCGINKNRTINPAVDHCCLTNPAFRRHCFESLEADKTYVPPPTSRDLFIFHTDLCQAPNEELQKKKDRFLVNLVKLKPGFADQELRSLFLTFTAAVEKCCKAQEPEACFNEEVSKLGN